MRCLIGFFGISRSLRYTADSIRACFDEPLRQAGIPTLRAGHFNLPETIDNPRSSEFGLVPDAGETALLSLDLCSIEPQSEAAIATRFELARQFPDSFRDDYRSLANLCHQLHSLERLWSLLLRFEPVEDDLVLLLRPDLLYVGAIDLVRELGTLMVGQADIVVPSWQSWGGLNDRFAFCSPRAARIYATRNRLFTAACQEMRGMHAETFLAFVASCHGLRVGLTDLRALRIRANGQVAANDAAMMAAL